MVYNYKVVVVQKMPPVISIRKHGKINRNPLQMIPYLPQSINSMPAVMSRTYNKQEKKKRKTKKKSKSKKKASKKKKGGGNGYKMSSRPAPYKRFVPLTMRRKTELKKQKGGKTILRPRKTSRYLPVSKKRVAEIKKRKIVKKKALKKKVARHIKRIPADQRRVKKGGSFSSVKLRPASHSRYEPITQRAKLLKKKGGSSHHPGLRYKKKM